LLDIYHGVFAIARMTLFRYLCNISVFELLAVPQRVCVIMASYLITPMDIFAFVTAMCL